MSRSILFLDLDGVLNSERTFLAFSGYPDSFDGVELGRFDPVAVGMIRHLCEGTGCELVLSSSWRYWHSAREAAEALDLPIVDVTPTLHGQKRGHEIAAWLQAHPEVTQYAIVDDVDEMLDEQRHFLVLTSPNDGLLYSDFCMLRYMLLRSALHRDC